MAISLRDFLTFPFNSGRGIRMNQIDGAQLHFVTSSWDDAADPTHLILSPFLENVPEQALFFFRLPGVIPRKARALTARIGATNIERPLVGIDGSAIPTRLLAPNYLYGTLMDSAAARLIEPLFPRPQDFTLVCVPSYDDRVMTQAEADAVGTDGPTASQTAVVPWPEYNFPTNTDIEFFLGVPLDAPDISGLRYGRSLGASVFGAPFPYPDGDVVTYGGEPMKWWRNRQRRQRTNDGWNFYIEFAPYT